MVVSVVDKIFAMAKVFSKRKQIEENQYTEFLKNYELIIRNLPVEVIAAFGNLTTPAIEHGGRSMDRSGIELTIRDFLWWKNEIENKGTRFVKSPQEVMMKISDRILEMTQTSSLTIEERNELLNIILERNASPQGVSK